MNEIKTRNIKEIRELPISQLTDEEILKAAVDKLKTNAAMLVYNDNGMLVFLGRYKALGYPIITQLKRAWEEKFGKFKKIEYEEQNHE